MEVVHINDAAQKGDHVNVNEAVSDINQIRKSANTFIHEVGEIHCNNVRSVGRKMRFYETQFWEKHEIDERRKFKCLICNKVLCHFWSLRNHMFLHLEVYPFKCFACDKKYPSSRSLSFHVKHKHYDYLMSFRAGHWLD